MGDRRRGIVVLAGLALLFFIGELFFVPKTYLTSRIGQAIQAPIIAIRSLVNQHSLIKQLSALQLENQSLRAQLLELASSPHLTKEGGRRLISAQLFSSYPFNTIDELLVAAGDSDGVSVHRATLAAPGLFLGEVSTVSGKMSTVRTIFSTGWELPVKIGSEKVDALLIGGRDPRLTLISKKKRVSGGETIVLTSREFPLGLTIGSVGTVKDNNEGLFLEASIIFPYSISNLSTIFIVTQ